MTQAAGNKKNAGNGNFHDKFSPVILDLAVNAQLPENGRKALISIRNLKQYFPVKGNKNMFVKANDGIDLDIYEGETLGLVGESGCGKSTLGRTLLQLYAPTEGQTFYYGRPLNAVSPKYLIDIIKDISGRKQKLIKLYQDDRKAAMEMFLQLVHVFGGLLFSAEEEEIAALYLEYYSAGKPDNNKTAELSLEESRKFEAQRLAIADSSVKDRDNFEKLEKLRDDGIDLSRLTYNEMRLLRRDMQIIFQDPYSSLNPRMTVGQIIGEGLLAHEFFTGEGEDMQNHVMKVMEECGLASYMIHRYPHQFSGGQRQRIGIARSLAVNPKFVVCDEAVSALDVSIQSQILNLLSDLKEKENLTYLFISHDLSVIKYISDRIGVMYLGNIVEIARSEDIFRKPLHPYTEALLSAIPTTNVDKPKNQIILEGDIPSPINPPRGCKFHTRCRYAAGECKETEPLFREVEPGHFAACHYCLT
ncbi:MAG: ATP-binding cassette domain-containing protein [Treponema sp.]|nr:ATP-binding cassette domain-containing protein [Treponema sp.]